MSVFKPKTYAQIIGQFTKVLDDLQRLDETERESSNSKLAQARVFEEEAAAHAVEASRAAKTMRRIEELLG